MTLHRLLLATVVALPSLVAGRAVLAQGDPMHAAHVAMANQTGVMQYCKDKGWADQAAVDAQKKAASAMPAAADQSGLAEAEASGRRGSLVNEGTTMTLASMAQQSNTTEKDLCGQMASSAKMAGSQSLGMPGMPGGMSMPAMPPGMSMPAMPGMPKAQ